ncbi:hypothetical protein KI387_019431, partial [Taxus chinensis]
GKHWTPEQVSEIPNYIKHLQLRVKDLTQKREEMRKENLSMASEAFPIAKVNCVGSRVYVSINAFKCDVLFSDVLRTLENNGLDIVTAIFSAISDRVFITICAEVSEEHRFDSTLLYEKVWNLVSGKSSNGEALESCLPTH